MFVVFVSHHNSWDTWKMVEDMMLSPMCMPCGAPHPLTPHTTQMFTDAEHQTAQNSKASKCPEFDPKLAVGQNLVALPWKHPITSNNNHYGWKNNGSSSPIHMVMMEMDESIMNPWAFARNMDRSCTKSLNKSPASSHLLTSGPAGLSHASRSSAICPGSWGIHQKRK